VLTLVAIAVALLFLPAPWSWLLVLGTALVDLAETGGFLWWSRRRRAVVGVEALVGRRATTVGPLLRTGQVRVDGELWDARSEAEVEPGEPVVIRAVNGLVLDVEPVPSLQEEPLNEKH
jgi:membrane protein implicated in regulation of membrane protease activity